MYCYRCGLRNADDAQFCINCHTELRRYVKESSPQNSFPLEQELATAQEFIRRLRRYVPPIVAEYTLHDPKRLRGERREVAVLIADAVNFTPLSASLDAEAVFDLINDLLGRLVSCVHRYDGMVDKFTGDGLLAVFGAPVANENDTEMAVRAALDMQTAAAEFAPIARAQVGAPLQIRIGIHTGLVTAGILGTQEQAAYTVIGETVNMTARLESLAVPGHIIVSSRVHVQTQALFDFQEMGNIQVKGFDQPIAIYEVIQGRTAPAPTRGIPGVSAVFLGRETELSALQESLKTFLVQGEGAFVVVRGEAGMGKSRLVTEWLKGVDTQTVKVSRGRGLPYVQGVGYGIFRSLLEDAVKHYSSGTQVERWVSPRLRPFLKQIMGLPLTEEEELPLNTLEPERIKQLTALVLREWVAGEARESPVILILEDFHWADDLSRDVLQILYPLTVEAPVIVCIVTRPTPEKTLGLPEAQPYRLVEINPLTPEQSRALLAHHINLVGLPDPIIEMILTRAEGNPFYIEEFVRMLIEKELLRLVDTRWHVASAVALQNVEVPISLRALMMARVDRLPENLRHVLRDAAVIGLQFDERLLAMIENHFYGTENVMPYLDRLTEAGLLEKREDAGTRTFAFRHILTQEIIYNSILHSQRPELHRVVAESIKNLYCDNLTNQAEVLALHYDLAHVRDKALYYTLLAGDRARQRFANREAIEYYSRALQLSQHLNRREADRWRAAVGLADTQQHIGEYEEATAFYEAALDEWKEATTKDQAEVMLKLGRVWDKRGGLEEAETWLRQALSKVKVLDNALPNVEAGIFASLGWLSLRRGDLPAAGDLLEEAVRIVEKTQHYDVLSAALNRLGAVYYNQGDLRRATQAVERSLDIREELGDLLGVARSSNNLGILKHNNGDWNGALENYKRCLSAMEQIGDIEGQAIAHTNIGNIYIEMGKWGEAERNLQQSADIAQRIANPYEAAQAHMNLGRLYLLRENWDESEQHLDIAITLYAQAGARANPNLIDAYWLQGLLFLEQGNIEKATLWAERSYTLLQEVAGKTTGASTEWGRYEYLIGRIALAKGELVDARTHLQCGKVIFENSKSLVEIGRAAYWLAQIWLARAELEQAVAELIEAQEIFHRLGAAGDLKRVDQILATLNQGAE